MKKPYLICLLLLLVPAHGVTLPEHNCSKYFTYGIEDGENYFGLFTAPKAGLRTITWSVSFVWQGLAESPIDSWQDYPSTEEAIQIMNSGRRVQLIVRFKNIGEQLPQLVQLQVNGETLCSSTGTGNVALISLGISATKAIRTVNNARPEIIPNFPTITPKRRFGHGVGFKRF